MNVLDLVFPYKEPLTDEEAIDLSDRRAKDVAAIEAADFSTEPERALDEAQRVFDTEAERARSAESKATTYLAVLAALVPLVLTIEAAVWEHKSSPAPEGLKLALQFAATVYLAAAGYHAFRALRVSGFQKVSEAEVTAAWTNGKPLEELAKSTLLASRRSRDAVNEKVTRIRVSHEHLVRAFAAFIILLCLDPLFYAFGKDSGERTVTSSMQLEADGRENRNKGAPTQRASQSTALTSKTANTGAAPTQTPNNELAKPRRQPQMNNDAQSATIERAEKGAGRTHADEAAAD